MKAGGVFQCQCILLYRTFERIYEFCFRHDIHVYYFLFGLFSPGYWSPPE